MRNSSTGIRLDCSTRFSSSRRASRALCSVFCLQERSEAVRRQPQKVKHAPLSLGPQDIRHATHFDGTSLQLDERVRSYELECVCERRQMDGNSFFSFRGGQSYRCRHVFCHRRAACRSFHTPQNGKVCHFYPDQLSQHPQC